MFMWIIRSAANAPTGTGPFGSQFFATYNRASHFGDGFGATYDWLQWCVLCKRVLRILC